MSKDCLLNKNLLIIITLNTTRKQQDCPALAFICIALILVEVFDIQEKHKLHQRCLECDCGEAVQDI